MKVAIVGGGIHGTSAAKSLALRGHEVSLFEQFPINHVRGSSHGESRIVRKAYPDPFYTSLMAEAYPLWRDLEALAETDLLHEVGLLYLGSDSSANLQSVDAGLSQVEEPHTIFHFQDVKAVSPQVSLGEHEIAIFTPRAGWVDAHQSVTVTRHVAERFGAKFHHSQPVERKWLEKNFDAFVVAPGAWILDWAPELNVKVTLQTVAFLNAAIEGPVWIEDSEKLAYGFPTHDPDLGAKVAFHAMGGPIDPSTQDRTPDPAQVSELGRVLERRFALPPLDPIRSYGCLYTNTPDEDFRLGTLGESGFYVSACSGHGFKFGPWIGQLMADFVEQRRSPRDFPRFCSGDAR